MKTITTDIEGKKYTVEDDGKNGIIDVGIRIYKIRKDGSKGQQIMARRDIGQKVMNKTLRKNL